MRKEYRQRWRRGKEDQDDDNLTRYDMSRPIKTPHTSAPVATTIQNNTLRIRAI